MDQKSAEQLQSEMNDTRTAISEKVALLESHVLETIYDATSAVQESAHAVNCAVKESVGGVSAQVNQTMDHFRSSAAELSNSVKSMFNIADHVRQNPWMSIACSTASGFLVGRLLGNGSTTPGIRSRNFSAPRAMMDSTPSRPREPGLWDDILQMAQREVRTFAETALTTLATSMKSQLQQQVNKFGATNTGSQMDEPDWAQHEHNGASVP